MVLKIGWREWIALPELGLPALKAKIDTGAKTSALHALNIERFTHNGQDHVRFITLPLQKNSKLRVSCKAKLIDQRSITNSGGDTECRYVIQTPLALGGEQWPIQVTLTDRSELRFRMLLGRQALNQRAWINPSSSYLLGKIRAYRLYT